MVMEITNYPPCTLIMCVSVAIHPHWSRGQVKDVIGYNKMGGQVADLSAFYVLTLIRRPNPSRVSS